MIVVLEGPDCAGKTTLAKVLVDEFGLHYHHEGPPPSGMPVYPYYKTIFDQVSRNSPRGVVFDRFALSEEVYGPVLRNRSGFHDGQYDELAAHIAERAVQVLCLPPLKTCLTAWNLNKENELLRWDWQVEGVWRAYEAHADDFNLIWDYTFLATVDKMMELVKSAWEAKQR